LMRSAYGSPKEPQWIEYENPAFLPVTTTSPDCSERRAIHRHARRFSMQRVPRKSHGWRKANPDGFRLWGSGPSLDQGGPEGKEHPPILVRERGSAFGWW